MEKRIGINELQHMGLHELESHMEGCVEAYIQAHNMFYSSFTRWPDNGRVVIDMPQSTERYVRILFLNMTDAFAALRERRKPPMKQMDYRVMYSHMCEHLEEMEAQHA